MAVNSYDGPGYVEGVGMVKPRRDGVKKSHRDLMLKFREIGKQALNAADYERTRHLPIGRGRLACDLETGDFDPDADRLPYNKELAPKYPKHLHSTVTDGEFLSVHSEDEEAAMLATRKWARKPLERKRRFVLTPEDQLQNLKGQIEAERAGRLEMERRLESTVPDQDAESELANLRREHEDMKERFEALMLTLAGKAEAAVNAVVPDEGDDDDEDEVKTDEVAVATRRSRR